MYGKLNKGKPDQMRKGKSVLKPITNRVSQFKCKGKPRIGKLVQEERYGKVSQLKAKTKGKL